MFKITVSVFAVILFCGVNAKSPFQLTEFLDGTFVNKGWNATWISEKELLYKHEGSYYTTNVENNDPKVLLKAEVIKDLVSPSITLSPNRKFVLIRYNPISIFRHSTTAQYSVFDLSKNEIVDHIHNKLQLQLCQWGHDGNSLIYVYENDIHYQGNIGEGNRKLTKSGVPGIIYNGVPDWVYEEEVLSAGSAMWLSPNGENLAYIEFDDTKVEEFTYYKYGEPGTMKSQYPEIVHLKYPKAEAENPSFKIFICNFMNNNITEMVLPIIEGESNESKDKVIHGVSWISETKLNLYVTNRIQNKGYLVSCIAAPPENAGDCVVERTFESKGWLQPHMPIYNEDKSKYVLIASNEKFASLMLQTSKEAALVPLTKGRVITDVYGWSKNIVYYAGPLEGNHSQQHIFSMDVDNKKEDCLTCELETPEKQLCRYAQASFNKEKSYVSIICQGPGPTFIQIINLKEPEKKLTWEGNEDLRKKLADKHLPTIKDVTVDMEEYTIAVRMLLPPNFDSNRKYPMIVNVYGGPNSNQIKDSFSLGFENYVVTNKTYIYAYIDGRGSGRRGEDLMFSVYKKLGTVEIEDQIAATKELVNEFSFIDKERVGIWGWSYGGYATAWALVKDDKNVFKCGLSVAPVTSYIYYDSIYTERYMDLPSKNEIGYNNTDLTRKAASFKGKNFFLIHGNADDNVHYQQSMLLARALELNDVPFQQMSYPDENHNLRGVYHHLYHTIDAFFTTHLRPEESRNFGSVIKPIVSLPATIFVLFRVI